MLAALFFLLSLGMGIYLSHHGAPKSVETDLGVMSGLANKPAATQNAQPAAPARTDVPQATPAAANADVPAAVPATTAPAKSQGDVPAATEPAKH